MVELNYIEHSINEGGAFGHLSHPFEDHDLIFKDLKEMIDISISGAFNESNFVREKTDGINLLFTWKNGDIRFARNRGHLKNGGGESLSLPELVEKFAGRGSIQDAFRLAGIDLKNSIKGLKEKDRNKIFANGKRFVSVEIIYPSNQITVPYGMSMLVFHGAIEHDIDGRPVNTDNAAAKQLSKMIEKANLHIQKSFFVRGPNEIKLEKLPNSAIKAYKYKSRLEKLMSKHSMMDTNRLGDWYEKEFISKFSEISKKLDLDWNDNNLQKVLIDRLFRGDKSKNLREISKTFGIETSSIIRDYEKSKDFKKLKREIISEMENLFLSIGTDIIKNLSIFLAANPTKAAEKMRKNLENTIKNIKETGDPDEIQKLDFELRRLESSGGMKKIAPSEGITFVYKGKLYKYTGLFASIHQLNSIISFRRK